MINPQLWEQQMQGGVAQGLGYALLDDFPAPQGLPQPRDLATYLIPNQAGSAGYHLPGYAHLGGEWPPGAQELRRDQHRRAAAGRGAMLLPRPWEAAFAGSALHSRARAASPPGGGRMIIEFILNGQPTRVDCDPDRRVVDLLHQDLGFTGVK